MNQPTHGNQTYGLIITFPYTIHKILTDNGIQFTHYEQDRHAFPHSFERVCKAPAIEHRKTKVKQPWTNRQVERMNRTLQDIILHMMIITN